MKVKDLNTEGEEVEEQQPLVFEGTQVTITVEKIGVKDAKDGYVNPFCTVSVVGATD